MAIQEQLGGVVDSIFGGTFTVLIWVIIGLVVVGVAGGFGYYFFRYRKKFDITVKVISRRAGENKVYFDKGAVFKDKKNSTTYMKLFNTKVQLEMPKFNILYSTNKGDYAEILRESEMGFRFLMPPVIDKKSIVKYDGKLYPITSIQQRQIESDITWILERQKVNKNMINPQGMLMKLLEFAPQIISMGFSFIMLWIVFRYAPDLLNAMNQAAAQFRAPVETEVIGSFLPALMLWKKKV
jgi:hypothetical protein